MPSNIIKINPVIEGKFEEINQEGLIIHQNLESPNKNILEKGIVLPSWEIKKDSIETYKTKGLLDKIYDAYSTGKRPEFLDILTNRELDEDSFAIKTSRRNTNASWTSTNGPHPHSTSDLVYKREIKKYKQVVSIKIPGGGVKYRSYYDDYKHLAQNAFWKKDSMACIAGDGDNKPIGILEYNAKSGIGNIKTRESKASGKIDYDDLVNLKYSLVSNFLKNATFVIGSYTPIVLEAITDKSGNKVYKDGKLLEIPVCIHNGVPTPDAGNITIILGDFKNYVRITDIGDAIKEYRYPDPEDPGGEIIRLQRK